MTATMAAASAMEAATTAHAAAMEASVGHIRVDTPTGKSASARSVVTAAIGYWPSSIARVSITIARMSINRVSIIAATIPVIAAISIVVPRPRSDKYATRKPRRAVIPIGRASVGIVPVVSISADRSIPVASINRSSNPNSN
jgi:hypothetical protein